MTKSTIARRTALLSSASFGLAAVVSAASLGAAFAPTGAFAQTVTCVPAATSGNGTAAGTYAAGTYNPGILCNYVGDTATVTTSGAISVSTSGGVPGDPLVNGVNLRATGTDDITWTSTAGTVTGGNQTNGPVIDARTASGNITVNTAGVAGEVATTTHGIFAQSSGGGNVSVNVSASAGFARVLGTNSTSGQAGIEARSTGGNGDVSVTLGSGGQAHGRLYGIRAEASGSGDLTIAVDTGLTASPVVSTNNVNTGDPTAAAIYAKTGTGLLTIDFTGQLENPGGARGASALRIETGGDAILNLGAVTATGVVNAIVDMTTAAGTQTTLTHSGAWGNSHIDALSNAANPTRVLLRTVGGGDITINSNGLAAGRIDMSASTGDLTWNVSRAWITGGTSLFGAGDATINIAETAAWALGVTGTGNFDGNGTTLEPMTIDFGAGDDRITNNGEMVVGARSSGLVARYIWADRHEAELSLLGLETFENAGTIYFGASALPGQAINFSPATPLRPGSYATGPNFTETDYSNDDVLLMPGTHWIGSGGRLVIDAFLDQSQSACDVSLRQTGLNQDGTLSGSMPAADCLNLEGGSTEGETTVLINQLATGDRGGAVRIVLVDVAGGTSEGGHFVLDPMNHGYNPGGYLDLGYVIVPLVYDADAQQHVLLGTAGQNAWQTAGWAAAAHDMWRTSTGSWFDRQADLRGDQPDGYGGGIWLRTSADFTDREVAHVQTAGTSAFTFDNSYEQRTYAITGGADLLVGGGADSAWAVGLMAGYANSELTYDASPNTAQFDSWNGGLYASFLAGGLYIDAALTGNRADIKADMPALTLFPVGTVLDTTLLTTGLQIEGGWRFPVMDGAFIEPLGGVSWVRTKWEDLPIASDDPLRPGIDVEFDDPTSLRANIGARVGMDQDYGGVRAQYSVLGRVWNEFEGEHNVILHNTQDDIFVGDAFTGQVSELGLGASIYGSVVNGFLNIGGKWGDDYEARNASVGIRLSW